MGSPTVRERLINKILNDLDDAQVDKVLRYTETLQTFKLPAEYDEDNDPAVGFLSGPTDLAERSKEILRKEFGVRKHWTDQED